eukprot:TRINITY_DN153_c0_g1_i1.p1 TRINITY_DN153_c0_g1~~TRINITY_DN153_c0_g1_i1.p1  ORF type:complete len:224 (+),score=44.75 TRINITY_DN153_c0_g1_i1:62-733(+)
MSLTVLIRTVDEDVVHEVELSGFDRVKDLYRKAAEASAVEEGIFLLHFEGVVLDNDGTSGGGGEEQEIQQLGMGQGSELLLCGISHNKPLDVNVSHVELWSRREEIARLLEENPELSLAVDVTGLDCLDVRLTSKLPSKLRHLKVWSLGDGTTSIGDSFLSRSSLVTLDLTALRGVQSVEHYFLRECKSLTTVDLHYCGSVFPPEPHNCRRLLPHRLFFIDFY